MADFNRKRQIVQKTTLRRLNQTIAPYVSNLRKFSTPKTPKTLEEDDTEEKAGSKRATRLSYHEATTPRILNVNVSTCIQTLYTIDAKTESCGHTNLDAKTKTYLSISLTKVH